VERTSDVRGCFLMFLKARSLLANPESLEEGQGAAGNSLLRPAGVQKIAVPVIECGHTSGSRCCHLIGNVKDRTDPQVL
jgi:hypothetical protein